MLKVNFKDMATLHTPKVVSSPHKITVDERRGLQVDSCGAARSAIYLNHNVEQQELSCMITADTNRLAHEDDHAMSQTMTWNFEQTSFDTLL
jgi:hypothetical protein